MALQFRTVTITAECLYSLVNGDDMYMTFAELSNSNLAVWIFSKVYLYTFICLFIYIVLSLFIGIISDTYERLKVRIVHVFHHMSLATNRISNNEHEIS